MQISSFSLSSSVPPVKSSSPAAAPQMATDETMTNFLTSPDSFSGLVQQAGNMPEVRGELVDSFKSRIQAGQYPTGETLDRLTDAIGSNVVEMADSSSE